MNQVLILNNIFLKNKMTEMGIKQWWLAEQIGVDRKTVMRWLQGKVRNIQKSNAEELSKVLQCELSDLTLSNEADQLATSDDQRIAAQLLISSSIVDKLGPIGEWNVIESLLKATIVPNLPINILGELYNQLTVASWRQSKIDQAEAYNKKAEEIAVKCGDKSILAAALLSKANIHSWRGKTTHSIDTYKACLALEKFIEPKAIGSTYSNLGAVLFEAGDLVDGEIYQKRALEVFSKHGKPVNLSIAWFQLAYIYLEQGHLKDSNDAIEKSVAFAKLDDYRRGIYACELILSEIAARSGEFETALSRLDEGLHGFGKLGIEEGLNYEFAGRVARICNDLKQSIVYLKKGIEISEAFPIYLAGLYLELARTHVALGDQPKARESASKSADLYQSCEAPLRAAMAIQLLKSVT